MVPSLRMLVCSYFFALNVLNLLETKSRCSPQDSGQDCFLQTVLMKQFPTLFPPVCAPSPTTQLAICSHTTHQAMLQDRQTMSLGNEQFLFEPPVPTTPHLEALQGSSGVTTHNDCQLRAGLSWKGLSFSAAELFPELILNGNTMRMKLEIVWHNHGSGIENQCELQLVACVFNTSIANHSSSWDVTALQTHRLSRQSTYKQEPSSLSWDGVCFGFLARAAGIAHASCGHARWWVYDP